MSWGENKQEHYKRGRAIREVRLDDIEAVCQCGYVILTPKTDFENHNSGLAVKRKGLRIIRADGSLVKVLHGVNRYCCCNACVNKWK